MSFLELFILAVGLSMDAFAVSVCKGLAEEKINIKSMCIVGLWFGGFQALMPTIGYALGSQFSKYITDFDHWIAFVLLCAIGINMIREAHSDGDDGAAGPSLAFKAMLLLAVATSIDALAVGVTFAFLNVHLLRSVLIIGITTFLFSAAGMKIGSIFGARFKSKAEIAGGVILILIGIKILLEHLGIINF